MVPDDGEQPPPQLPPHVSVAELAPEEYLPAGHSRHDELEVAPTSCEYVPAPQLLQAEAPAAENFPAAQTTHVKLEDAPVAVEYVPAAHAVHTVLPGSAEYVPCTHWAQVEAA